MIGVGMRQCDLVFATAPPSGDDGPKLSAAPAGSGLLATGIAAGETEALAASSVIRYFRVEAQHPQLAMNARGSPSRILRNHLKDQGPNLSLPKTHSH